MYACELKYNSLFLILPKFKSLPRRRRQRNKNRGARGQNSPSDE